MIGLITKIELNRIDSPVAITDRLMMIGTFKRERLSDVDYDLSLCCLWQEKEKERKKEDRENQNHLEMTVNKIPFPDELSGIDTPKRDPTILMDYFPLHQQSLMLGFIKFLSGNQALFAVSE